MIGIESVAARVLCKRHNNALSELDTLARRLTEAYCDALVHLQSGAAGDFHRLFNGHDVERYLLKALCGMCASMRIPHREQLVGQWQPPDEWLAILYGTHRFRYRQGMYVPKTKPDHAARRNSIFLKPILIHTRKTGMGLPIIDASQVAEVAGLEFSVLGFSMSLYMKDPTELGLEDTLIYRPRMRRFPDPETGRVAYIHMGWEEAPPNFAGKRFSLHEVPDSSVSAMKELRDAVTPTKRRRGR